jgi:hypothetical protein
MPSNVADLQAALAEARALLTQKSGEVSLLRSRDEMRTREQIARAKLTSQQQQQQQQQQSQQSRGGAANGGFPSSSQSSHPFPLSQRGNNTAAANELQRLQQQVNAMRAQKESAEIASQEVAQINQQLKKQVAALAQEKAQILKEQQSKMQIGQQRSPQQQQPPSSKDKVHPQSQQQQHQPRMVPAAASERAPATSTSAATSTASVAVPSAQAAQSLQPFPGTMPLPWSQPAGWMMMGVPMMRTGGAGVALSSSTVGGWSRPSWLAPSHSFRANNLLRLEPLEQLFADLEKLKPPPLHPSPAPSSSPPPLLHTGSFSARTLVKQEQKDPMTPVVSASATARSVDAELHRNMWKQLRDAMYAVLHLATTPVSSLLPPLRQLLLLLSTPAASSAVTSSSGAGGSAGNSSAVPMEVDFKSPSAVPPMVKPEQRATSFVPSLVRSRTDGGGQSREARASSTEEARRQQMLKLCMQVLLYCCSHDADLRSAAASSMSPMMVEAASCGEQVYSDLVRPPFALVAAANATLSTRKAIEPLSAEEERTLWDWGSPKSPPPSAAVQQPPLSSVADTPLTTEQKLEEALSFASLLKHVLDDALAALPAVQEQTRGGGGGSSAAAAAAAAATAAHPLALIELVVSVLAVADACGSSRDFSLQTLAQRAATEAGEDRYIADWMPRVARMLLVLNAAAAPQLLASSSTSVTAAAAGVHATPTATIGTVYASMAGLLSRWCVRWPHRLSSEAALQSAVTVVPADAGPILSGRSASCSCSVLELLLLWSIRLGEGSTVTLHSGHAASLATPSATAGLVSGNNSNAFASAASMQRYEWAQRSMLLLRALHACWQSHLSSSSTSSSKPPQVLPPTCPVHAREKVGRALDVGLDFVSASPHVLSLFALPFVPLRLLCNMLDAAVTQMHSSARVLNEHQDKHRPLSQADEVRHLSATHTATLHALHAALSLLRDVLGIKRRHWHDLSAQCAAIDAATQAAIAAAVPQAVSSSSGRAATAAHVSELEWAAETSAALHASSLGLLLHRVSSALDRLLQGAATAPASSSDATAGAEKSSLPATATTTMTTPQHVQARWPASLKLAQQIATWFAP